ncbi:MAG: tyrosine-type recombinase/integrase [Bacteroidetes bacterium]|nr:tyrosine-type recombinase/integrase [Bacteroidota bacterium]
MKLDSFLQYIKYEKRYSEHTQTAYRGDLTQFNDYLKEIYSLTSLVEVRHLHIRAWVVQLLSLDYSARSVNRKLSTLKSFFRFQQKRGTIEQNPMKKVIAPKSGKRLPVFVHEKHLEKLFEMEIPPNDFKSWRDRLILEMLYGTGIRRSELLQLTLSDIEKAGKVLKVKGKGGKERLLPLADYLLKFIEKYVRIREQEFPDINNDFLVVTTKGQEPYPKLVYNVVKSYLSSVTTLEQRSPHVLRHSFATHLSDHGADLNAIKELLGHSSLAATQIYTHNSIEKLKKVYLKAHPKAKAGEVDL